MNLVNYYPGCIHIGFDGVSIFDSKKDKFIWDNEGNISFNGKCTLGQGVRISNHGNLIFGNNVRITANSFIICYDKVEFKDDSLISWSCSIMDTDFHKILNKDENVANTNKPISIGKNVWIGQGTTILKGTEIGNNNVVASNSVLTGQKIKESNCIVGTKVKILKRDIYWKP